MAYFAIFAISTTEIKCYHKKTGIFGCHKPVIIQSNHLISPYWNNLEPTTLHILPVHSLPMTRVFQKARQTYYLS